MDKCDGVTLSDIKAAKDNCCMVSIYEICKTISHQNGK